jgi:hypothetical protein
VHKLWITKQKKKKYVKTNFDNNVTAYYVEVELHATSLSLSLDLSVCASLSLSLCLFFKV